MDAGFLILGLAVLAIPFAVIYLLIAVSGLKDRLASVERHNVQIMAQLSRMRGDGEMAAEPQLTEDVPIEADLPAPVAKAVADGPWNITDIAEDVAAPAEQAAVEHRFFNWLRENWVYVVSAASLGLAGIFFVQYGIENGLLPPWLRVMSGIGFGCGLIAAGEWMRRRHGDDEASSTAFLPSVFAGAGLVSVFAATLAARQVYGLIGPEVAFAGHLVTAAGAVALGWFYGPLLVAVGLIGAALAPFIVAGGSAPTGWLYGYFALIAAVGLAVDAVRGWPWVSRLALILGYAGGFLMMLGGAGDAGFIVMMLVMAVLAATVPVLALVPQQAGPAVLQVALLRAGRPSRAVILAVAGVAASSLGILGFWGDGNAAMLAFGALTVLALAFLLWAEPAEGLADAALLPALAFLAGLVLVGWFEAPLRESLFLHRVEGLPAPMTVTWLLAMAALISGGFALRSFRREALYLVHVLAAVLVAPVAAAVLEMLWVPGAVIGAYPWALHVMALAGAMVALALRYARDEDRRPLAYATLSALSLIALALFLVASSVALSLALAVLVLAAAWLDRQIKLPEMGWFIQVAVAVLGYRLLADPGIGWAFDAPLGQVVLAFVGVIAALVGAIWLLRDLERILPKGVMESAAVGFAAILANVLISRVILGAGTRGDGEVFTHWGASLNAMPWLVMLLTQLYRMGLGGSMQRLRKAIALVAGALGGIGLIFAVGLSPLTYWDRDAVGALVRGPMIIDSLMVAYGIPAAALLFGAWKLIGARKNLRLGFVGIGAGLMAFYVAQEIRRFFQGDFLGGYGVTQGELYAYTLVMMLLGAGFLYQAIAKRSGTLRKIAMAVIGVTVAKVFLLDAAGLTGLTRVVSFLGLGLSLAGLAWLNRWAGQVSEQDRGA